MLCLTTSRPNDTKTTKTRQTVVSSNGIYFYSVIFEMFNIHNYNRFFFLLLICLSRFGSLQSSKIVTEQVADTPVEYFITMYVYLCHLPIYLQLHVYGSLRDGDLAFEMIFYEYWSTEGDRRTAIVRRRRDEDTQKKDASTEAKTKMYKQSVVNRGTRFAHVNRRDGIGYVCFCSARAVYATKSLWFRVFIFFSVVSLSFSATESIESCSSCSSSSESKV